MPHRCMECKNILESGELDLNKGCPVCGGKKFQYMRPQKSDHKDLRKLTVSEYVAHASAIEPPVESPKHREPHKPKAEHKAAEAKAVPDVKPAPAPGDKKPAAERIESVRILEKGSYDINLPMLLSRKELVMSREDGVYVVDLPSALKTPKKKKR